MNECKTIIHLTDFHLGLVHMNRVAESYFTKSLSDIIERWKHIDAMVITGDISDKGDIESYQILKYYLASLPFPVLLTLGNHDNPNNLEQVKFSSNCLLHSNLDLETWQIIGLNTNCSGISHGSGILPNEELERLDRYLSGQVKIPSLIAFHHPPIDFVACLENYSDLATILTKHNNAKVIVCGHIHQDSAGIIGNTTWFSTPSPLFQLEFRNDELFLDENSLPGYRVLQLWPNGTVQTTACRVRE